MIEQRAQAMTRRSIKTEAKQAALRLAIAMVDLTTLEGKDSPQKIKSLCRKAISPYEGSLDLDVPSVAAVCVYPSLVPVAIEALANSTVCVASVATGFPSGQYPLDIRLADVQQAVLDGADEIDMVINRGAFLSGKHEQVATEITQTRLACGPARLKIILETGELETYDNIRHASDLAIAAAADAGSIENGDVFIKTSTGKVSPGATMASTLVMLEAIRDHYHATGVRIGMKPAGGIRSAKTAIHYLVMLKETLGDAWLTPELFRFGASTLLNDLLRQLVKQATGHYTAGWDFSIA